MSTPELPSAKSGAKKVRKPRLAIMGEFSVGKSTLSNLLLGSDPLPVKVTATQLPPVWISYGDQAPYREDLDGNISPVDLNNLADAPLDQTAVIRIFLKADILEMCDLIDMPGISDPNMSAEVWQRVIHHADGVLWCTHATQAWRQSEAAVWKSMPSALFGKSFLLITRIDKLLTEEDRRKVVKRARRETKDMFADIFPISLTRAIAAQDDREQWERSGAHEFFQGLVTLLHELSASLKVADRPLLKRSAKRDETDADRKILKLPLAAGKDPSSAEKIAPARVSVVPMSGQQTERPKRLDSSGSPANTTLGAGLGIQQEVSTQTRRQDSC